MKVVWSLPVRGERLDSSRGDLVRARSLIGALVADGHQVRVVEADEKWTAAAATSCYRRVIRRALPRRAALVLRDLGRGLHAIAHSRRVAAAVSGLGADLIVETQVHFADSGARAARRTGVPLLLDDCSPAAEEEVLGAGLPGLARRMFRRQAGAAAVVTVSSPELARRLAAELPWCAASVVPNGLHLDAYAGGDRAAARRRLGACEGECIGAFVGSFQPWHHAELLAAALARLPASLPFRALLVGDGPGRESALEHARRLGVTDCCISTGALPASEIPALLAGCDLGVLPGSNDYGQPMKLLEYAAAGLPAVAPDLAPVRALIEHGRNGLLFKPGDAEELARGLALLAGQPELRRRLGEAARARLTADVSWGARARQLVSAACAGGAPPSPRATAPAGGVR